MMTLPLKSFIRAFTVCAGSLLCWISACRAQTATPSGSDSSDLILINGKVITVDPRDSVAQAISIHNGKIVAVGTNGEIRKSAPKGARVIDLHGRTATHGLIDTHCHFDATPHQQRNGLLKMLADFNAEGMTAAKDPGIEASRWDLYRELLNDNKSTVRIFALFRGGRDMNSTRKALAQLQSNPKPPQSLGDG